jgi:hypothetical protein
MSFCQPCKELVSRHWKAARWAAFFIVLSLALSGLGMVTKPINAAGFCLVYP